MNHVIGVDTGNKCIKTVNHVFVSGIKSHGIKPAISDEVLEYKGVYYTLTSERIAYLQDKTETEEYFILTLFAIAKELNSRNIIGEDVVRINLAVGLPPSHLSRLKETFSQYFKKSFVAFKYNDKDHLISIEDVKTFPQGYAAIIPSYSEVRQIPKSYIIDIGGYTTDVILLKNGIPDMAFCESLNFGVIELYNRNYYKLLRSIYHAIKFRDISYMYVNNMPILVRRLIILLCGYKYKFNYGTSDLWYNTLKMKWNESVSNEIFSGTVLECFIEMDKFLWCYSNKASDYAIKLKQTFPFQKVDYCGMQIRGGDKFLETQLLSPELYFNKLQNIQPILILTDDYGIIKQIKNIYPEKNFFSYCEEDEHGYFNEEFVLLSPYIKYIKTVKLLVQVELLRKSKLFIGTHNAGPGEYLKIVMPESKYISIN